MKLFVLNSGSSSIKYSLFNISDGISEIVSGQVERIGEQEGTATLLRAAEKERVAAPVADHHAALKLVLRQLGDHGYLKTFSDLAGCAHRVVHGGAKFSEPTLIDHQVLDAIEALIPLAPLHNPANLEGIRTLIKLSPDTPQIAFFDTAFHHHMPEVTCRYALPEVMFTRHNIRRYGFHGLSHHYLRDEAAKLLKKPPEQCNLITLHLGNGASATAIRDGKSIDTSMGFTPLEGLVMGTRPGDIDAGILLYLMEEKGMTAETLNQMLNHESGLKGICHTNDMREILTRKARGDRQAKLAFEMFCYRIKKYIGAYTAILGHVDAVVFAGGIGEHSATVRQEVCSGMEHLGLVLDRTKNRYFTQGAEMIHHKTGRVAIVAAQTNEAMQMARESARILKPKLSVSPRLQIEKDK